MEMMSKTGNTCGDMMKGRRKMKYYTKFCIYVVVDSFDDSRMQVKLHPGGPYSLHAN
jgi:hypothetical protein